MDIFYCAPSIFPRTRVVCPRPFAGFRWPWPLWRRCPVTRLSRGVPFLRAVIQARLRSPVCLVASLCSRGRLSTAALPPATARSRTLASGRPARGVEDLFPPRPPHFCVHSWPVPLVGWVFRLRVALSRRLHALSLTYWPAVRLAAITGPRRERFLLKMTHIFNISVPVEYRGCNGRARRGLYALGVGDRRGCPGASYPRLPTFNLTGGLPWRPRSIVCVLFHAYVRRPGSSLRVHRPPHPPGFFACAWLSRAACMLFH